MADLFYILTAIYVTFSTCDLFFALLYTLPILFIVRFRHRNNMFILNICLTIITTCIYFIVYFLLLYYDSEGLFLSKSCILVLYGYSIAAMSIPFSFVSFTVHRFYSIKYHTKAFFKTKQWVIICIASQWISECIISLPFLYKQQPYCTNELWMNFYILAMGVFIPSLVITILNIFIFAHVRSSARRVQPQTTQSIRSAPNNNALPTIITRREILLLRQMIFTFMIFILGWTPVYFTIILGYFIYVDPLIISICVMLSQLCILSMIINLFLHNHGLKLYLKEKIRFCW